MPKDRTGLEGVSFQCWDSDLNGEGVFVAPQMEETHWVALSWYTHIGLSWQEGLASWKPSTAAQVG